MNPIVTVRIDGLEQLVIALNQIPVDLQAKPLRAAVAAGARLVMKQAKENAEPHRLTGTLEKNIVMAKSRRPIQGQVEYSVGIRKDVKKWYVNNAPNRKKGIAGKKYYVYGEAYYWRFIEFGTSKYSKTPFLIPAFESKKMEAIEVIKKRLAIGIEMLAKKWQIKVNLPVREKVMR
jgi:HK97 gp10 family phage protein